MPVLRHHSTFDEDGSEDLAHGQRHLGAQRSGIGARLSLPRVTLSGGLQRSVPDKILDMLVKCYSDFGRLHTTVFINEIHDAS